MAEDKYNGKPLKALESVGKQILTGFLDNLVEKNVLKLGKTEKKKYDDARPGDKAWVLASIMRQKRDEASQLLVQTFLSSEKNSTGSEVPAEIAGPAESEESTNTLKLCPHQDFLKLHQERAGEIYPIKERQGRTRLALIICNREFEHLTLREGAEIDIAGMKGLLEDLGYNVDVEEKLTAKEMESVLQVFAARPEHKTSDSTFLVFMSHGILDGICGTTHSDKSPDVLPYDTIFRLFNNRHCPSLKDKPKVIIVQACRGANRGELWVSDSPEALEDSFSESPEKLEEDEVYKAHVEKDFVAFCSSTQPNRGELWVSDSPEALEDSSSESPEKLEEDAVYKAHVEKDFIAFCSSTPHNVSWRDKERGSLFITKLVSCFQKYSWRCHIEEVFRKVQLSFEKPHVKAQMPTIERLSMTRYFYLFPGN